MQRKLLTETQAGKRDRNSGSRGIAFQHAILWRPASAINTSINIIAMPDGEDEKMPLAVPLTKDLNISFRSLQQQSAKEKILLSVSLTKELAAEFSPPSRPLVCASRTG
ncbi:hypothetical protein MHYP_G00267470 [Metynnis hypsauchen]